MSHVTPKWCVSMAHVSLWLSVSTHGVATISRLLKIIRLFCRISSLLQNIVSFIGLFCKRDVNFTEPTNRSHPIWLSDMWRHDTIWHVMCAFAKEPYKRDDILQKRRIILWSLLETWHNMTRHACMRRGVMSHRNTRISPTYIHTYVYNTHIHACIHMYIHAHMYYVALRFPQVKDLCGIPQSHSFFPPIPLKTLLQTGRGRASSAHLPISRGESGNATLQPTPEPSHKLFSEKFWKISKTTSKNRDFVVYDKGLFLVGIATRVYIHTCTTHIYMHVYTRTYMLYLHTFIRYLYTFSWNYRFLCRRAL